MPEDVGLTRLDKGLAIVRGTPILLHEPSSTLILGDLHLGYEEAMARTGVFLPRLQLPRALHTLKPVVESLKPKRIVVNGDIKHAFDKLLRQEAIEIIKFIEEVAGMGVKEAVLVRGNHDNFVTGILKKRGVDVLEDYLDLGDGVIVAHGHKEVDEDYEIIIMGHEHPALQINIGGGKVKYQAFLLVPLDTGATAVVMPAMGSYQTGNPVTLDRSQYLSPIMRKHAIVEEIVPIITDETIGTLTLPKLKTLPTILG